MIGFFCALTVSNLVASSGGLEIGSTYLLGDQGLYTSPSIGVDLRERYQIGDGALSVGFNLGAEGFLPKPYKNNQLILLLGLPLQANAFLDLAKESFVFRLGLGVGPYVSGSFNSNRTSFGVTLWAQPQVEVGFKLVGGGEILLVPAYNAYFEILNPGGSYVHGLSLRLAVQFAPKSK